MILSVYIYIVHDQIYAMGIEGEYTYKINDMEVRCFRCPDTSDRLRVHVMTFFVFSIMCMYVCMYVCACVAYG